VGKRKGDEFQVKPSVAGPDNWGKYASGSLTRKLQARQIERGVEGGPITVP